jgi:hypothetical protein
MNMTRILTKSVSELCLFGCRKSLSLVTSKLRILFSKKDDWEYYIRDGFRYTGHILSFEEFSLECIQNHDLIIPLTVPDLKLLSEFRTTIISNKIPIPTIESICLCDNKERFNNTLVENNFEKYIPKVSARLRYPYILKKKEDAWGKNSHIIFSIQEEQQYKNLLSSPDYFVQMLIPGEREYATHLLYTEGRIVNSLTIEYLFDTEYYIKGKDKPLSTQKIEKRCYLDIFSSILRLVGFEGLCCFNYKIVDNRPIIFEINPRFGGSLSSHFYSFIKCLL